MSKIQTHTVIHQKQIHADTVAETIHINKNLVHAITDYLFRISSSRVCLSGKKQIQRNYGEIIVPTGFYLHRELLVLSLK